MRGMVSLVIKYFMSMASPSLKLRPNCNCEIFTMFCTASYSYPSMLILDPLPHGGTGSGAGATILACTDGCILASLDIPRISMFYGLKCYFVTFLVSAAICGHLAGLLMIKTCRQLTLNSGWISLTTFYGVSV